MERLPDCLFNHILDIYSGKSNFPGNLACASKRCKVLCDAFKDEKLLLEGRALVRVHLYASYLNTPVHERLFLNVKSSDYQVPLPDFDCFLEGPDGQIYSKEGWNIEKMTLMFVMKGKHLVTEIPWHEHGMFETYNYDPEDVFGENGDGAIQNYTLTVEHEYNEEDDTYGSLVISLMEWESTVGGSDGGSTDIATLIENWNKVIVLD